MSLATLHRRTNSLKVYLIEETPQCYDYIYTMKLILAICCLLVLQVNAQVVPSSQYSDWSGAGYDGNKYVPALQVNVLNHGAVGDGITNDHAAVQAALNIANISKAELYFPPGQYLLKGNLTISDSVIISGYSADSTRLLFDLSGAVSNCINISRAQTGIFSSIVSGYIKGSSALVVNNVGAFTVGSHVELRQQNGTWDTQPASWASYSVGQLTKITSIIGDTLFLNEALRITYDSLLMPQIRVLNPIVATGLKCIVIQRLDTVTSGDAYNINLDYAYNSNLQGVYSYRSNGSHISINSSNHITMSECYIHESFAYDGTSTRGYGVMLRQRTSNCLIENNVFRKLRHAMIVKEGANGNVFGYNYSIEPLRTEFPTNAGGDISLHGHFAYANLFEGNIVQNIHIDQAWGPSGPYNTFLRNRAELYGIIMSTGSVQSDAQNFVGNEVTNTGFTLGNYILNGSGHFAHGNNIKGTIQPTGTGTLNDLGYYYSAAPMYWVNAGTWPTIGIPNTLNSGTIPAKIRYTGGSAIASCVPLITSNQNQTTDVLSFDVFPNPTSNEIWVRLNSEQNNSITIINLAGVAEHTQFFNWKSGDPPLKVTPNKTLSPGVYGLQVQSRFTSRTVKILVL